jgi:hypothetical protein
MVETVPDFSKIIYTTIMKKMIVRGESMAAAVVWVQDCLIKKKLFISAEEISSWIKNGIQ